MRSRICLFLSIFVLLSHSEPVMAEKFIVVEDEFQWYSPNLIEIPVGKMQDIHVKRGYPEPSIMPLGDMAYNKHFDSYGAPPPFGFLRPLEKGPSPLAQIKDGFIIFHKAGRKVLLNRPIVPSWADPANPYLLSIPNFDRIFVVYPYYLFQDKENKCFTEMYSNNGVLLATFDTLPTHYSISNPYLLISPERCGCCDSLRWSIRFYDLHHGSVSEYNCPEGFCGDVLFTKLGEEGPFLIVQEIVGYAREIGLSLQTNVYIIKKDGTLSASGKIIHAVHRPNINKHKMRASSPYAVSNLLALDPLPEEDNWLMNFIVNTEKKTLKLVSTYENLPPSVVFLLSNNPSAYENKGLVKMAEKTLGNLPLLGITEPGQHTFSVFFDEGCSHKVVTNIESDRINIVTF